MSDRLDIAFATISGIGGGLLSYLYGGWNSLLGVLLVFVIIDYLTGFFGAAASGTLKSSTGYKGIAKKVGIFFLVAVAHMVDLALGQGSIVRDATISFYLANELLSIIENSDTLGIPIPPMIRSAVELLKGKEQNNTNIGNDA